jgi:hypothetical protein
MQQFRQPRDAFDLMQLFKKRALCNCRNDAVGNGSFHPKRSMIMTKFATFAAALGLTATSALAGGYVAPVVDVEPVVVEEEPASSNAGLVIPALLLLGVIAAVASDDDDS